MRTSPTQTAVAIFDSVQRQCANAVFLCVGAEGPRLSFGVNQTDQLTYRISLRTPSSSIFLSSEKPEPFALLLDDLDKQGHLRLVLYLPDDAPPCIDWNGFEGDFPVGEILILAYAQNGIDRAVLHAVFAPSGQSSIIIDSSPKLSRHLGICSELMQKEELQNAKR